MLRKDFYFRQIVTEGELDAAFDGAESAEQSLAVDNDLAQKANGSGVPFSTPDTPDFNALLGGIFSGLTVTISGLSATVAAGKAYDYLGRRIAVPIDLTVDLSATGDTALGEGGVPTGGSSTGGISSGQFRYILLMVYFNRLTSDPRTDGNSNTVYFNRAESFQFRVKMSNPSATPTIPGGDANCIILGAFKRDDADTIVAEDYSTRGDWIRTYAIYSGSALPTAQAEDGTLGDVNFIRGTPRQAIIKLRNAINLGSVNYANHISQSAPQDKHAAKNIDFTATTAGWADGGGGLPTVAGGGTVSFGLQATIESIIVALGNTTSGQGGTKKIGGASLTGSPVAVASGTLRSQLQAIVDGLNTHLTSSPAHIADAISFTPDGFYLTTSTVQSAIFAIAAGYRNNEKDNLITSNFHLNTSVPDVFQFETVGTNGFKAVVGAQGLDVSSGDVVSSGYFGLNNNGVFISDNARPADSTHWTEDASFDSSMFTVGTGFIQLETHITTFPTPFGVGDWALSLLFTPNTNIFNTSWRSLIQPRMMVKAACIFNTTSVGTFHGFNAVPTHSANSIVITWGAQFTLPDTNYIPMIMSDTGLATTPLAVSIIAKTTTHVTFNLVNVGGSAENLNSYSTNISFYLVYA